MSKNDEWWRNCVIYQIYPRSFMDSNGDGIGDLPGIVQKLDHVASLGVDAIWISPFFKSPMKDFGYDVSDYRDVDPIFGSLEDFKQIIDKAHRLGIKVLIDQVWSHTSDQHDWFKESRQSRDNRRHDWYVWADAKPDGTPPNNWLSYFGGPAWTWDARRCQYYLHHFLKEQPNLNLWNPLVRERIKRIASFWFELGVDGFRLDVCHTYAYDQKLRDNPVRPDNVPWATDLPRSNPMGYQTRVHSMNCPENISLIEELRAFAEEHWPDRCFLGEAGGDDSEKEVAQYTQTGKRLHMAYSFGLVGTDMAYEDIKAAVKKVDDVIGDGWICWAIGNHDFKRAVSRIKGEAPLKDKALFATTLGLSLRGSYCMFQGEELGLPQAELAFEDIVDPYDKMLYPEHCGRDGCRTPIPWDGSIMHGGFTNASKPWLPVPPEHSSLSVHWQEESSDSNLNHIRRFMKWYRNSQAIKTGDMEVLNTSKPVFAVKRTHEDEEIIAIFNCSDSDTSLHIENYTSEGLICLEDISNNFEVKGKELFLKPFGYTFWSK